TPPEMLPHHYKHEKRGLEVLEQMNRRMTLPNEWKKSAAFVIREHMRAPRLSKPGKIVELLMKLNGLKLGVKDFCDIIRADNHGLPPYLERAREIIDELLKIGGKDAPPEFKGAEVGKWIFAARTKRFVEIYSED
ncbi:MAG: tRNA adenylyltransferase, partial [Selenomonadaceae bacterium]|nr:tRNA adenylyltransferase [Selenomonadaceae bacterium]